MRQDGGRRKGQRALYSTGCGCGHPGCQPATLHFLWFWCSGCNVSIDKELVPKQQSCALKVSWKIWQETPTEPQSMAFLPCSSAADEFSALSAGAVKPVAPDCTYTNWEIDSPFVTAWVVMKTWSASSSSCRHLLSLWVIIEKYITSRRSNGRKKPPHLPCGREQPLSANAALPKGWPSLACRTSLLQGWDTGDGWRWVIGLSLELALSIRPCFCV